MFREGLLRLDVVVLVFTAGIPVHDEFKGIRSRCQFYSRVFPRLQDLMILSEYFPMIIAFCRSRNYKCNPHVLHNTIRDDRGTQML
jgi:hypothetical protein